MQRDPSAYLNDILEAAAAIQDATAAIDEDTYTATRLIRSAGPQPREAARLIAHQLAAVP